MKFIIDYDRRDFRPRLSQMDFRSLDDYTIDLQFVSKSVVFELEEPNTFTFCIKDRDNNALVFEESFTKVGTGDSLIYRIPVQFATVELAAFLGDSLYKDAYLSIRWSENGQYRSLPATKVRLYRSLVDGTELVNAGDPPYPPSEELLDFMNEVDFFLNSGNGNFVGAAITVDFATVNTTLNANSANITNSISVGSISGGAASFAILTAVTQANSDDSTLVATTEFVHNVVDAGLATKLSLTGGTITGGLTVDGFLSADSMSISGMAFFQSDMEIMGGLSLTGEFSYILAPFAFFTSYVSSASYEDSAGRYTTYLASASLITENGVTPTNNGKISVVHGTSAVVLTIPDDNSSNPCCMEIINHTTGAGTLTLTAASSVQVNGVVAGSIAIPRHARVTLKRVGFDNWSMQIDVGMTKGPYADDSAAAAAGVVLGESYYTAAGEKHVRVS